MTPCFEDWKRFCFVPREIASGNNDHPLSGLEAQKRAQGVLTECGYRWSGNLLELTVQSVGFLKVMWITELSD